MQCSAQCKACSMDIRHASRKLCNLWYMMLLRTAVACEGRQLLGRHLSGLLPNGRCQGKRLQVSHAPPAHGLQSPDQGLNAEHCQRFDGPRTNEHLQVKIHGVPFPEAAPTWPCDVVCVCRGIDPIDTGGKGDAGCLGHASRDSGSAQYVCPEIEHHTTLIFTK